MSTYRVGLYVLLFSALLFGAVVPALAQDDPPQDTRLVAILTLAPLDAVPVGTRAAVQAKLVNQDDQPVPNKVLVLYVDGDQVRQIRTDARGEADIRVSVDLPLGKHDVEVVFGGTEAYQPARATQTLTVRPIQLTIETVPRIANVRFELAGETFVTGEDGLGVVEIDAPGTYDLRAIDVTDILVSDDTRVTFSRWADSTFQPERTIEVTGDEHLQAGFDVSHRAGLTFTDLADEPVAAERVTLVTLKRSDGSYFTFENSAPQWLTSTRIVRRKEGLEASPLLYSVESVTIDGTNAVNRYQQKYYVEPEDTWSIQLLMYAVTIYANDAVFGFGIGDRVALHYPDGRIEELVFGDDGSVYKSGLARGLYHVQVLGVSGMAPLTPIALSRDQDVGLKVLSAFDIGAGVVLGVVVALSLLFYKRPFLLFLPRDLIRAARRKRQRGPDEPRSTTPVEPVPEAVVDAGESDFSLAATPIPEPDLPAAGPEVDRDPCVAWLIERFHPDGFKCPHCGGLEASIVRENQRNGLMVYRCADCHQAYNLYTGTPLAGSQLTPAQVERLLCAASLDRAQLAEELGLTVKTVRKWQDRLRTPVNHAENER